MVTTMPASKGAHVTEVKIGVIHTAREIMLEVEQEVAAVQAAVAEALADDDAILWLTDVKGRAVGIPSKRIAYVECAEDRDNGGVGFARR